MRDRIGLALDHRLVELALVFCRGQKCEFQRSCVFLVRAVPDDGLRLVRLSEKVSLSAKEGTLRFWSNIKRFSPIFTVLDFPKGSNDEKSGFCEIRCFFIKTNPKSTTFCREFGGKRRRLAEGWRRLAEVGGDLGVWLEIIKFLEID